MRFTILLALIAAVAALTSIISPHTANAMAVTPIVLDIGTTGNTNHAQISVLNDGAKPLPVEIIVSRIELNESGEMDAKPAADEFLIFPPQALVRPGATQVFRLQWVGDPQLKRSQSYSFSVNQVPVKMPEGKSGVQVVFNFGCIVNVAPQEGSSAINVVKVGLGKDKDGKVRPELTVSNPGNIHAKLVDATIHLASGSWSESLRPEQLHQRMGSGLIQPGKTRKFLLPIDVPAGVSHITANIEYKKAK